MPTTNKHSVMTNSQIVEINSEKEMIEFAQKLSIDPPRIIGLRGTLGAGKSFFARNFINSLQDQKTNILSPTFNIALTYPTSLGDVYHFDLYRIKEKSELENIGFFEAVKNNISIIEWPEIAINYLQKIPGFTLLDIKISAENSRVVRIEKF